MSLPDGSRRARTPISRRDLLRGSVLGATAIALTACGSSVAPSTTSSEPPASRSTARSSAIATTAPAPASPSPQPTARASGGPPLLEKIAGLIVVGFRGSSIASAPWLATALRDGGLGGVVLFDRDQLTGARRNVVSRSQLAGLVADLRAAAGRREIIVSIDQEGGIVTRLSPAWGFPSVASEAQVGRGSLPGARAWASGIAATLSSVGVNLNFAPVVDLNVNPKSPAIGGLDRSFGASADVVVTMATAEIQAHRRAGIRTTLKHFPGIGSSTANTDFGVADVTKTWSRKELEPFRRLIAAGSADLVMAGHVVNGQLDADHPASLSKAVVAGLLRGELGWDGIVVTDDLQAAAIEKAFGRDEAVLLALEAGNDILLFANQQSYDPGVVARVTGVVASAVRSGRIAEARIDEARDRVMSLFGATG